MPRYVVVSRNRSSPTDQIQHVVGEQGVTVIDDSFDDLLLIEASESVVLGLRKSLGDLIISEETFYPKPGPKRHKTKPDE